MCWEENQFGVGIHDPWNGPGMMPEQAVLSSLAKRQHQNPGAGERRKTNRGLFTEVTGSRIFFLACEEEVRVPLGNRVYMRQAEKLKTIA